MSGNYVPLYRKYRPQTLDKLVGQEHIKKTLTSAIELGKIAHAFLFTGPRGTGKTSTARILAKSLNCKNGPTIHPCGECESCRDITNSVPIDVIEIDAASNRKVEDTQSILEKIQYVPVNGRYKIYIIDEVHMLTNHAFNALLKTLEEPPENVIFILATTEAAKIPITIMSRCQRYDFHRISIETIADRLTQLMKAENISVEDRAIKYVAKAADGSMRDALSLLDQCIAFYLGKELKYENVLDVLGAVDTEVFSKMYKTIKTSDVAGCMNLMEDIIMQGRDLSQFVTDFVWYLRNLLLIKTTDDIDKIEDVIEVSKDNIKDMIEDARDVDVDSIMRHIRVLSELSNEMKYATQKRVKAEVAFIKLMKPAMESPKDMQELAGRVNDLENQLSEALSKLQSGAYITKDMLDNMSLQSGGAGALGTGSRNDAVQEEKPVLRRNYDAVTDDIKQIAGQWSQIVASMDDALLMNLLKQADVTVTEDGNSLEIMVKSISGYNVISREETIAKIEELIEERTGISVRVVCTRIDEDEDFNRRYIALEELVGMDIEIDDKEEFI